MIDYDFEKSPSFWVGMTAHMFETALNAELAGTGITLRQVQVLASLALHGPLVQAQLAEMMRIEPSTLVRLIDRMERDDWVVRQPDPDDRRKKLIHPTKKVETIWADIIERGGRMEARALRGVSAKDLKQLNATLAKIRENIAGES